LWIDDEILLKAAQPMALGLWVPERPTVVLGSSNDPAVEADAGACARDGVQILKRYGGGGTVVLHQGCVVVSIGAWVRQHFQNRFYFDLLNQSVIDALALSWPHLGCLSQQGLSDITVDDRKVAGTSLFRSRNYLLYQASLLVEARAELFETYLRHPSREPDYRKGRGHRGFVMGLVEIVPRLTPAHVLAALRRDLAVTLDARLGDELVEPFDDQVPGLLTRARSGAASAAR
jgi:lipoate-protein ligase A